MFIVRRAEMLGSVLALGLVVLVTTPGCPDSRPPDEPCSGTDACDDGDPCTADACVAEVCESTPLTTPECSVACVEDSQCSDVDTCEVGRCVEGSCTAVPDELCCIAPSDCAPDGDPCTTATCSTEGVCLYPVDPTCTGCTGPADCDDGDDCTADACTGTACEHEPIASCGGGEVLCGAFPSTIVDAADDPPGTYDPLAWLCFDPCGMTTTEPVVPTPAGECEPAVSMGTTEAGQLFAGVIDTSDWQLYAADTPVEAGWARVLLTAGEQAAISVQRRSDDARFDLTLIPTDGSFELLSAGPGTGPLPHYGGAFPCGEPHRFDTGVLEGSLTRFVSVCDESTGSFGICTLHGDVEATPETETCSSSALHLGYFGDPLAPYAQRGSGWTIDSASHGTGTNTRTGMPLDTDVTFVVTNGSGPVEVVARWDGTSVDVVRVTH